MNDIMLHEALPSGLEKALKSNLGTGETIFVQPKGAFKEPLIFTDRRVMIIKSGFMTGQMFGSDIFPTPYGNIASAEVKYRILSGYFEVSAGGMQNTAKSYWSTDNDSDPAKAPNCVSFNSKSQANGFRRACSFIMERIEVARGPRASATVGSDLDVAATLERLWKLKTEGASDQTEYEVAKKQLLAR